MVYDVLRLIVTSTTQALSGVFELKVQTMLDGVVAMGNPGVPIDFLIDGTLFKVGIITNENGWINYLMAASLVGAAGTTHVLAAQVDGKPETKSNNVSVTIQAAAPPPSPPPITCPVGTHLVGGVCVADPIPPPPDTGGSWFDKFFALFPDALKPYAIPLSILAAAAIMKGRRRR